MTNLLDIIAISAIIAIIVAVIVLSIFYKGMKKVKIATEANLYVVPGSFKIRKSRDYFLYSTVIRVKRDNGGSRRKGGGFRTFPGGRPGGFSPRRPGRPGGRMRF